MTAHRHLASGDIRERLLPMAMGICVDCSRQCVQQVLHPTARLFLQVRMEFVVAHALGVFFGRAPLDPVQLQASCRHTGS